MNAINTANSHDGQLQQQSTGTQQEFLFTKKNIYKVDFPFFFEGLLHMTLSCNPTDCDDPCLAIFI